MKKLKNKYIAVLISIYVSVIYFLVVGTKFVYLQESVYGCPLIYRPELPIICDTRTIGILIQVSVVIVFIATFLLINKLVFKK